MSNPNATLSVLVVEDNLNDAELMLHQLRLSGFTPRARRVQNEQDYCNALEVGDTAGQPWDVILSDHALPGFSGQRALELLRERGANIPFIVISGAIGEELAVRTIKDGASDYLLQALDIPYCHHEKWDGTGYPRGLKGEQIPLAARMFAIVDVWDALCSNRPYRSAWPVEKVRAYICEQSGQHFDPAVVEAFLLSHFDA
jgi:response regulator RpfG family c-di-GMP phosphodiesterase